MRFILTFAAAAAISVPASAAWHVAQSRHFVIYSDDKPASLTEFATKLERFDQAARFLRGMDDPPVGDAGRLTIYVLPTDTAVAKLAGNSQIDGFYSGRVSGAVAFVPKTTSSAEFGQTADTVFFHEYSHHLMFQNINRPVPQWITEGFAEFMSTVSFERNGGIGIGRPANHRVDGLYYLQQLPIEKMLGASYTKLNDEELESIYGRGWLLYHYLTFEKSREGQLNRYADLIASGQSAIDAARNAFGDLKRLNNDLNRYLARGQVTSVILKGDQFSAGKIDVRPLSEGAAAVMPLRIRSKAGVNDKTAEPLAAEVRAIEARYPGDELVELTLAEAEMDSGHAEAAEAAANRALKVNPRSSKGLIFKGRAIVGRSKVLEGAPKHAGFEEARKLFIAANKIDTEDAEALDEFYNSYAIEGLRPTPNSLAALHYAAVLAPQDGGVRMTSAYAYLNERKLADAKAALIPIAYDPHGGEMAASARRMIEKINAGDADGAMAVAREPDKKSDTSKSN